MSTCFHCNDSCQEEIEFDDHVFCCAGCKMVYEILNGKELKKYYSIDDNPGVRPNGNVKGKYNYLDIDEFKDKLVFFEEGDIAKVKFFLPQIHCSSCLWLLERLPKIHGGVIQSQVDFVKKEVTITYSKSEIGLRALAELCATIGYSPKITLEDYGDKKVDRTNKRLIILIGLTGFCFGNIMLISFPEYLGLGESDRNFRQLFSILNFVLSIPVLIFGARDYLVSAYKAVRIKTINIDVPISIGIIALYARSVYEIVSQTGAGYMDSFAGLIFFLLIGKWFQHQTYASINFERDYESYFPISVSRKKQDEEEIIALKSVLVGDRLVIRNNELIPTDCILIKGNGNVDYSFVSGESAIIQKNTGDKLYAGGRQEGTSIEVEVIKEVQNSYLTQLWNNPIFDKEKVSISLSDKISRYFTFVILGVALLGGIVWYFIDPAESVFVVTSVLIVACPCAIALSVPFTYGNGIRIFGRKGFYLRSTKVIEPMTEITAVVFDKTGTITENNALEIHWQGKELDEANNAAIYSLVSHSSHPLSRKITQLLKNSSEKDVDSLKERLGEGISGTIEGEEWKVGNALFVGEATADNQTRVYISLKGEVLGSFVFSNSYREGIQALFASLSKTKNIHILSGDNDAELEALKAISPAGTIFNFNQTPEDKLIYIAGLQARGERVMMLGDGLNDAGALQQSQVGISVVDDVYAFSPASDGILSGNKLAALAKYLNFASYNKRVVKWSYAFSLLYNIIGMIFALSGSLTPLVAAILMPLSSISVVILVTLLTNLKGRGL
ncbi:MAG: HAD-IC family P-type ATPase [Crocinitomix sp.]|nr:HAD-IC family P-type ATPase [Crocinitomix sp.]